MPLTTADRKHQMPYGSQKEVAAEQSVTEGFVSLVMNDALHPKTTSGKKKLRRVQVAIARKLGVTVDEAFPPAQTQQETAPLAHAS